MNHPLRCLCGSIQGHVDAQHSASRAVCYCRDCQAFARFLGRQGEILNGQGGTEIIATLPRCVHFDEGKDSLACMSLGEKGMLRWYAACCRTPIGNTPRDRKTAYVGLVSTCLTRSGTSLEESFGPLKIVLNTDSARGKVAPTPAATFFGILKIVKNVSGARLSGRYKDNPFFSPASGRPIKEPRSLTPAEREALDDIA